MSKKILFIAHMQNHIMHFHIPTIKMLHNKGYEIYVATKLDKMLHQDVINSRELDFINWQDIEFNRNPFSSNTMKSFKQLNIFMKQHQFDLIHLNTPIAAFIGRVSANYTKNGPTVYTAHGFHFYKGAPMLNWMIYYPIEKIAARISSGIITINQDDYDLAKSKFKTKNGKKIYKVDGVGIDENKYYPREINYTLKENLGFSKDDFILTMIGEINSNKNQIQLIKSIEQLKIKYPNLKALLIGEGDNYDSLNTYIESNNLVNEVKMVGYRKDIPELLSITDILLSLSKREGLPKNLMEGMACEKPLIATKIRGNKELVRHDINGYLVEVDDIESTIASIEKIYLDKEKLNNMGKESLNLSKKYYLQNVINQMIKVYSEYIDV